MPVLSSYCTTSHEVDILTGHAPVLLLLLKKYYLYEVKRLSYEDLILFNPECWVYYVCDF